MIFQLSVWQVKVKSAVSKNDNLPIPIYYVTDMFNINFTDLESYNHGSDYNKKVFFANKVLASKYPFF